MLWCFLLIFNLFKLCLFESSSSFKSCLNSNVNISDTNYEEALTFYRACMELGLNSSPLPKNFMKRLAVKLRKANNEFLRQTSIPIRKLCRIERQINELYENILILTKSTIKKRIRMKDENIICTETTINNEIIGDDSIANDIYSTCHCEIKENQEKMQKNINMMCSDTCENNFQKPTKKFKLPFNKTKGNKSSCEKKFENIKNINSGDHELTFYFLLLIISFMTFLLCLVTCCYVIRIYSRLYLFTAYDDEVQSISSSTHYKGKHGTVNEKD